MRRTLIAIAVGSAALFVSGCSGQDTADQGTEAATTDTYPAAEATYMGGDMATDGAMGEPTAGGMDMGTSPAMGEPTDAGTTGTTDTAAPGAVGSPGQ